MSTTVVEDRVSVQVSDHVADVTLTRGQKHNALDLQMFAALAAAAEEVAGTSGVRAVVLHGEGKSFCAGLDVKAIMAQPRGLESMTDSMRAEYPNQWQRAVHNWVALEVPVIAAVHGACIGGGLQLALGADIRIAAPDAKLSIREVVYGLIPDMAITRTLPRLAGIDVAKELTLTGRLFDGAEAHALGLVTRLADDPLPPARALAAEIAAHSPDATRAGKRLWDESWTAGARESLRLEVELQLQLIGSENQQRAARAGLTGEPAEFVDPPR